MHGGLSTGPRTPEGKASCRAAALRNLEVARAALARKRAGLGGPGTAAAAENAGQNTVGNSVDLRSGSPIRPDIGEAIAVMQLSEAVQFGPHVLRSVAVGRNGVQAIEPREVGALLRLQSGGLVLIAWSIVTWAQLEQPTAHTGQGSKARS